MQQHKFYIFFIFLILKSDYLTMCTAIECKMDYAVRTIRVSQKGKADFTKIGDALNSIPTANNQWVKVLISPGEYREKIKLYSKSCIVLEGKDRSTTTITQDGYLNLVGDMTFDTYDVHNFVAKGITFRNSHNRPLDKTKSIIPAVALRAGGEKHVYEGCGFEGYQDTLWDCDGLHHYTSCYIEGAVDFIWGDAQSVYQHCTINVTGGGHITAQGRESPQKKSGFVFENCNILGTGQATLGRAYKPYSRVMFRDSYFSNVIYPDGWSIWDQAGHENDITFAEINCKGPSADTSKRVPWAKRTSKHKVHQLSNDAWSGGLEWVTKYLKI